MRFAGLIEFEMDDPNVPGHAVIKLRSKQLVEAQVSEFDVPDTKKWLVLKQHTTHALRLSWTSVICGQSCISILNVRKHCTIYKSYLLK